MPSNTVATINSAVPIDRLALAVDSVRPDSSAGLSSACYGPATCFDASDE